MRVLYKRFIPYLIKRELIYCMFTFGDSGILMLIFPAENLISYESNYIFLIIDMKAPAEIKFTSKYSRIVTLIIHH